MPCRCSAMMMRARIPKRMRCAPALLDIIAALWAEADGLPGPALGGAIGVPLHPGRPGPGPLGVAVSALLVSVLLVSALGSTTAGRSTYFGASAACALFDCRSLVALAGAVAVVVSPPPSDKLRSPACAAAEAKTNPAIRMNLRMLYLPLRSGGDYAGRANIYVRQVTPRVPADGERRSVRRS